MIEIKIVQTVKLIPDQLFTLGLDSQFGTLQGVIQAARDLKYEFVDGLGLK